MTLRSSGSGTQGHKPSYALPNSGPLQPISQPVGSQPSETLVIKTPKTTTTAEEATGTHFIQGEPPVWALAGSMRLVYSTATPIPISTPASPRLKEISRSNPNPTRPKAIALSNNTRADSQGTRPPLTASVMRFPQVISPST